VTYGEKLRELRAERRLSLREVEERGGPNKDTMSLIERNVHKPHPQTLGRIAEAFGMSVAELRDELEGAEDPLGPAPPSQGRLFNNGILEEQEEWRAKLAEVESFIENYALARAEYWAQELDRVRESGHPTADAAYDLAILALEEFSSIYEWLFDDLAHDLLEAMEEGGGVSPEIEEAYDALLGKLTSSTTRTQRALFDHARSRAKTPAQREKIAAKQPKAEALNDPRIFARRGSRAGGAGRRVVRGAEAG